MATRTSSDWVALKSILFIIISPLQEDPDKNKFKSNQICLIKTYLNSIIKNLCEIVTLNIYL